VARDGGPADRQLPGKLADRPVARPQQLDDGPADTPVTNPREGDPEMKSYDATATIKATPAPSCP
jgi:hypothetical protein